MIGQLIFSILLQHHISKLSRRRKQKFVPYQSELHNVTVTVEFWDVKLYILVDKYEEICWCHRQGIL